MKEKLKKEISKLTTCGRIIGHEEFRNAAVLILLFKKEGKYHFLFEKRSEKVRQPGEISFPGGLIDRGETVVETALRETEEELGISRENIEVLGELGLIYSPLGATVSGVVAVADIDSIDALTLSKDEVDYLFSVPMEFFANNRPQEYEVLLHAHSHYIDKNGKKIELLPVKELGPYCTVCERSDGFGEIIVSRNHTKGILLLLLNAFLWGIHGPAGRFLALRGVDMYFVAGSRLLIGAAVLFLFLFFKKGLSFSPKGHVKNIIIVSLIGLFLNTLFYHLALRWISGTLLMVLESLAPLFVILFAWSLHKKKPQKGNIFAIILSFIGLILIVYGKTTLSLGGLEIIPGILFGIAASVTLSFYYFFSGEIVAKLKNDPNKMLSLLLIIFIISSIPMIPFMMLATELPSTRYEWFWLVEMGVFQSGIAYIILNYAMKYVSASTASIFFIFTIFFTTINEVLFLDLSLNISIVIGAIFIIIAAKKASA